ncbi:MAG: trehalose-6-phosphate synthase, partial [Thermincola sp.]|nr:trehalose-6-phosphate synthase [Thermincola sp.]
MKETKGIQMILSIDRLDYTKGIPERLRAFGKFLTQNPEYREKV